MTVEVFSLQGKVYSAVRNGTTGLPGKLTWLGNVPEARIELTPNISDKYESFSGSRLLYARLAKEKKGTLTLTLDEWIHENLALALYNDPVAIAGTSVTGEVFPTGLANNDIVALDNQFVSAVVITDSNGTPATLVSGTDYKVLSANRGLIQILNIGSYTQPFKGAYTYGASTSIAMMMKATPPERYIVFDGQNTETGDAVTVDLYRVQFLPTKQFNLIDPDFGNLQLEGAILYDSVNAANANFGGFGRLQTNSTL